MNDCTTATFSVAFAKTGRPQAIHEPPHGKIARVARLLALAHEIERRVRADELDDRAHAARMFGLTRGPWFTATAKADSQRLRFNNCEDGVWLPRHIGFQTGRRWPFRQRACSLESHSPASRRGVSMMWAAPAWTPAGSDQTAGT
jgi:hypothetical protein